MEFDKCRSHVIAMIRGRKGNRNGDKNLFHIGSSLDFTLFYPNLCSNGNNYLRIVNYICIGCNDEPNRDDIDLWIFA